MNNKLFSHKGKLLAWIFILIALSSIHLSDHILTQNTTTEPVVELIPVVVSNPSSVGVEENVREIEDELAIPDPIITDDEQKIEQTITPAVKPTSKIGQELVIVHYLITKFLQNLDYSHELQKLDRHYLPQEINTILDQMHNYAATYLAPLKQEQEASDKKITDRIIGHFIKIKKLTNKEVEQKSLYQDILKDLHIIEDYFFSPKSLDKISNYD